MTVADLIRILNNFPADMPVNYSAGMFGGPLDSTNIALFTNVNGASVMIDLGG